jgi:hypothetical protein
MKPSLLEQEEDRDLAAQFQFARVYSGVTIVNLTISLCPNPLC